MTDDFDPLRDLIDAMDEGLAALVDIDPIPNLDGLVTVADVVDLSPLDDLTPALDALVADELWSIWTVGDVVGEAVADAVAELEPEDDNRRTRLEAARRRADGHGLDSSPPAHLHRIQKRAAAADPCCAHAPPSTDVVGTNHGFVDITRRSTYARLREAIAA